MSSSRTAETGECDSRADLASRNEGLDTLAKQLGVWQQVFFDLEKDKQNLIQQMDFLAAEKIRLTDSNARLMKDSKRLHDMIDSLQKQFHELIIVEDENRKLKSEKADKDSEIEKMKNDLKMREKQQDVLVEDLKKATAEETERVKETFQKELDQKVDNFKQKIENQNVERDQLQQQLHQLEKEKEKEIIHLSMKYEAQIKTLQRQRAQKNASQPSLNQEIFRKKVKHMKEEHEKEVNMLKQIISDMEQQLATRQMKRGHEKEVGFFKGDVDRQMVREPPNTRLSFLLSRKRKD